MLIRFCDFLPVKFWVRNKTWETGANTSVNIINKNVIRLKNTNVTELVGCTGVKYGSIVEFENSECEYSEGPSCENWQWSVDRKTNNEFYRYE